jgi:hypothetical protein
MPRGSFMGRETHGPEDDPPPDYIREDSPRRHSNRVSYQEAEADKVLALLTPQLVRKANGHIVEMPGHVELKHGDVALGAADEKPPTHRRVIDPNGGEHVWPVSMLLKDGWSEAGPCDRHGKPISDEMRKHMQANLRNAAYEPRVGTYKTGRVVFEDGVGIVEETTSDAGMVGTTHNQDIAKDLGKRGKP